jgi:hypothetical protein
MRVVVSLGKYEVFQVIIPPTEHFVTNIENKP